MFIFTRPLILVYISWNYFYAGFFPVYSAVALPVDQIESKMSTPSVIKPII